MTPLVVLRLKPAGSAGVTLKVMTSPTKVGASGVIAVLMTNVGAAGYSRSEGAVGGGVEAPERPPPPHAARKDAKSSVNTVKHGLINGALIVCMVIPRI